MKRAVVVFAAGSGSRMKSKTPKVLHTIGGKSMLDSILETAHALNPEQIILVVSKGLLDFLKTHPKALHFPIDAITVVVQESPKGSGHAMECALLVMKKEIAEVIVLLGDVPFVTSSTIAPLWSHDAPLAMLAMRVAPPHAYGRMLLKGDHVERIVEAKDAQPEHLPIDLVWTGVLKAKRHILDTYIQELKPSGTTGEYHLTGLVESLTHAKHHVCFYLAEKNEEFEGVNDKAALAVMEDRFQRKKRKKMLENGVKIVAPETVFFSHDTIIEEDVTVHPFVTFGTGVLIKSGAVILPHCHIEGSVIDEDASIGPFAHLRGGNTIGKKAVIGNFVEVKKSTLATDAKVKHLSYVGDATLGERVNVGAGTITCNYDGEKKHATIIERDVFVGANTSLVAPLLIEQGARIAAGSVITQDIPKGARAFARARQENKV